MNPRKISLILIASLFISNLIWAQTTNSSTKKESSDATKYVREYSGPWTFTNMKEQVIDLTKPVSIKTNPIVIVLGKDVYVTEMRIEQTISENGNKSTIQGYDFFRDEFSFKNKKILPNKPIRLTIVKAVDQYKQPVKVKNNVFTFTITE
ncbi:hypothetical protein BKI52_03370 [marine bacterium AO1-C]|nr:hypothetical protein BKI52_03370 [marine bacterium AO1-C]